MAPAAAFSPADERFMRRALALAERGRGRTWPNPMVGAVVVRGGRVIAAAYHQKAGRAHAEVAALAKIGFAAAGATLYVNLEPCCHEGRTGPCTEAIVRAGVKRVVAAVRDPNARVDGQGFARLRKAGVVVDVGLLGDEAFTLNRGFLTWAAHNRPHVTLKAAMTLDGFIAASDDTSKWITGEAARRRAHELRAEHDAVLVGAGTVRADDPRLDVRLPGRRVRQPVRVVLDGRLALSPRARLLSVGGTGTVVVIGGRGADARAARRLGRHASVVLLAERQGRVPVAAVLGALAGMGVQSVLVEGGADVHGTFLRGDAVDEVAIFVAPKLLGGGVPLARGTGRRLGRALATGPIAVERLGDDLLLRARVRRAERPATGRARRRMI